MLNLKLKNKLNLLITNLKSKLLFNEKLFE